MLGRYPRITAIHTAAPPAEVYSKISCAYRCTPITRPTAAAARAIRFRTGRAFPLTETAVFHRTPKQAISMSAAASSSMPLELAGGFSAYSRT